MKEQRGRFWVVPVASAGWFAATTARRCGVRRSTWDVRRTHRRKPWARTMDRAAAPTDLPCRSSARVWFVRVGSEVVLVATGAVAAAIVVPTLSPSRLPR